MATLEELQAFASLSPKEQLDAAFNAGATSLEEAQSDIAEVNQVAERGFLDQVGERINNLTPEQGAGLLAFGTQLSRGIQPGQSLVSSIGEAAQTGFATTQRAREAQLAQLMKQREEQLKLIEEKRKRQKLQLEQDKFERESLADPRLGKIDPFDFTPESLQRFQQTGNLKDLVMNPLARRGTKVDINTGLPFKIPSGFMLNDPNDPSKGVKPIPGGPDATMTPEQSAKAQLVEGALVNAGALDRLLFDEAGGINRSTIGAMQADVPFTEGRQARVLLRDAIEAKLRAESGAAVPETEVIRASKRFMPSLLDNDETIRIKRALLTQFLQGTYDKFDPTGAFKPVETIDALVKDSKNLSSPTKDMTLQQKQKRLEELRQKAGR